MLGDRLVLDTDGWLLLFTTQPSWTAAVASYRRRWAIEGSYRDVQSGWDGRRGWGLAEALRTRAQPAEVVGMVGLWALGALIQS